jgi:hypothetical protein
LFGHGPGKAIDTPTHEASPPSNLPPCCDFNTAFILAPNRDGKTEVGEGSPEWSAFPLLAFPCEPDFEKARSLTFSDALHSPHLLNQALPFNSMEIETLSFVQFTRCF